MSSLQLSLSFAVLVHTAPCCPTMSSLQRRFGLPADLTPFICHCDTIGLFVVFHQADECSLFPFRISYAIDSVALVICLMVVLRILSFCVTFSIFLSTSHWLVSSFFTHAFVSDLVLHPYVIAGKAHWLKTFLFRLIEKCPSRKIFSVSSKITPSCFYSYGNFLPWYVFHCHCLSHIPIVSHLLYFCSASLYVV